MTAEGTNGDGSIPPETTGAAGRPTVRRALVAAGELNPGSSRRPQPTREAGARGDRPVGRAKDVVPRAESSASAAAGATALGGRDADGESTGGPPTPGEPTTVMLPGEPMASGDDSPGDPDRPAGQDGEEPREPSRRRAKYLLAVAGVAAVLLVVLPLVNRGNGSAHDKNTAAGPTAEHTSASPSPDNGLVGVPKNLKTASAAPTKHAGKTGRPVVADPTTVPSQGAVPSHTTAVTPKKTTASAPPAPPTSLTIRPVAKLVNGAPWTTSRMQLGMQADGNLVLYDNVKKRVMWAAGTSGPGNSAFFQSDGNLVVYNSHQALWASNPAGFTNATLVLRSDGNLVIMSGGKQVWASNTHF